MKIKIKCDNCGKEVNQPQKQFVRFEKHFCTMACYTAHRNKQWGFTEKQLIGPLPESIDKGRITEYEWLGRDIKTLRTLSMVI